MRKLIDEKINWWESWLIRKLIDEKVDRWEDNDDWGWLSRIDADWQGLTRNDDNWW